MLKTLMLLTWEPNWCHPVFYLAPSSHTLPCNYYRHHLLHFHSWWKDRLQQLLSWQDNRFDFNLFLKGSFTYLGCVFPIRKSSLVPPFVTVSSFETKETNNHKFLSSDEEKNQVVHKMRKYCRKSILSSFFNFEQIRAQGKYLDLRV